MAEREGGPSSSEKAFRYAGSVLFLAAGLAAVGRGDLVFALLAGAGAYFIWPKQKKSPQSA